MISPYNNKPKSEWKEITQELIDKHPFSKDEIVKIVLDSWKAIFTSKIGKFHIGKEIFPSPQVLSFFLHELVAHNFNLKYPGKFRVGTAKTDKDIHCIYDEKLSVEIKASSNKSQIFANRSYAQPATAGQRKNKDGYFIAVNFEQLTESKTNPDILVIRFGYIEHSDWIAQFAATGQQARLSTETYSLKFMTLYSKK
jgi:hypothetical protein